MISLRLIARPAGAWTHRFTPEALLGQGAAEGQLGSLSVGSFPESVTPRGPILLSVLRRRGPAGSRTLPRLFRASYAARAATAATAISLFTLKK
jgi:hypothetical protein